MDEMKETRTTKKSNHNGLKHNPRANVPKTHEQRGAAEAFVKQRRCDIDHFIATQDAKINEKIRQLDAQKFQANEHLATLRNAQQKLRLEYEAAMERIAQYATRTEHGVLNQNAVAPRYAHDRPAGLNRALGKVCDPAVENIPKHIRPR